MNSDKAADVRDSINALPCVAHDIETREYSRDRLETHHGGVEVTFTGEHSGWEPVDGHFWCPTCARRFGDGAFECVRDAKTGEWLDRVDVRELEQRLAGQAGGEV